MKNYILTQQVVEKKLRRMAFEILENNPGEKELILFLSSSGGFCRS